MAKLAANARHARRIIAHHVARDSARIIGPSPSREALAIKFGARTQRDSLRRVQDQEGREIEVVHCQGSPGTTEAGIIAVALRCDPSGNVVELLELAPEFLQTRLDATLTQSR